jgi:hypothetical protein
MLSWDCFQGWVLRIKEIGHCCVFEVVIGAVDVGAWKRNAKEREIVDSENKTRLSKSASSPLLSTVSVVIIIIHRSPWNGGWHPLKA